MNPGTSLTDAIRLWASPSACNANGNEGVDTFMERRETLKAKGYNANGAGIPLAIQAKAMWPTPAARDYKGANSAEHVTENGTGRMHMDQLPNYVVHGPHHGRPPQTTPSGEESQERDPTLSLRLNPRFVEWLQGMEPNWTMPWPSALTAPACLGTPSSGSKQSSPSG